MSDQSPSHQIKQEIIHLRICSDEKEMIRENAEAANLSISEYLRQLALRDNHKTKVWEVKNTSEEAT